MIRGTTLKLKITVRNKFTKELIDCTRCNGILLGIYQDGGKTLQKWSLNDKPDFDSIIMDDAVDGILVVLVYSDNLLAGIRNKMVKFTGKLSFDASEYPDSLQINGVTPIVIEELIPDIFENVSPV